ncbi:MAG: translation initiation factor IF-3 [Candidatus Moranbacteria bacterium]|nr:translation initiation factor IF-3 [Candidatus Moranbacteria bacterium]
MRFRDSKQSKKKERINREIKAPKVRVIDQQGNQMGIFDISQAFSRAQEEGLDLVEIVPKAQPPVVKIMDYGKFQYNKKKQEKKNKAKSKETETKGIRLSVNIEEHDLEIKKKRAEKFLKKGNKVSIEVILKGREKMFRQRAKEVLQEFIEKIEAPISFDQEPKSVPRGFLAVIKPDK